MHAVLGGCYTTSLDSQFRWQGNNIYSSKKRHLGAPEALRTPTPHDGKILNYIHILTNTSYYHPSLIKA